MKEITKGEEAVRLGMKVAMGEWGRGDTGLEVETRCELDTFMRFGEERLSSLCPTLHCEYVNLNFLPS